MNIDLVFLLLKKMKRMKKWNYLFLLMMLSVMIGYGQQSINYPYKNPNLSAEVRAKDLLERMNIEDKIPQLYADWVGRPYKFD